MHVGIALQWTGCRVPLLHVMVPDRKARSSLTPYGREAVASLHHPGDRQCREHRGQVSLKHVQVQQDIGWPVSRSWTSERLLAMPQVEVLRGHPD